MNAVAACARRVAAAASVAAESQILSEPEVSGWLIQGYLDARMSEQAVWIKLLGFEMEEGRVNDYLLSAWIDRSNQTLNISRDNFNSKTHSGCPIPMVNTINKKYRYIFLTF